MIDQTSAASSDADVYAVEAAEAAFVLKTQSEIQKILNKKGLRPRDLAKRLNVTEARVSQMFGDHAKNLTLKTIARIYHQLGETAYITTIEEFERAIGRAKGENVFPDNSWTVSCFSKDLQASSHTNLIDTEIKLELAFTDRALGKWARAEEAQSGSKPTSYRPSVAA
jgi:DNA-binding Xre family transcriptional regulator